MKFHSSIQEAVQQLKQETTNRFTILLKDGTMSVEYYAPKYIDPQTSHKQNEIYVIASGEATFFRDGERIQCHTGDVLFVPAGMEHRFENFSDGFATWVVFYGEEDGETS